MKIPRIAIIDDGISLDYIPQDVSYELYEVDKNTVKAINGEKGLTHGSSCYQFFCSYVESKYHLISIKVLGGESNTGSKDDLLVALKWCANNSIDLIHMSMGTRQYSDFTHISEAISKLSKTVIVAACSNENTITFPACLPTVIGVRHCKIEELRGRYVFATMPFDMIEIMTYSDGYSNSTAAPVISALVCNYLAQGYRDMEMIKKRLKDNSLKDTSFLCYDFYKELLLGWEEINVPIVVISSGFMDVSELVKRIKSLVKVFLQDGYRAVCLSETQETDVAKLLFHMHFEYEQLELTDLIKLYYNYTMPDIILLHMDTQQISSKHVGLEPDIIITDDILEMDTTNLFEKIKTLLS